MPVLSSPVSRWVARAAVLAPFLALLLCLPPATSTVAGQGFEDPDVTAAPTWICGDGEGEYVVWRVKSGKDHGPLVVKDGKLLVGTNNGYSREGTYAYAPRVKGDRGIFLCLSAVDGELLWLSPHKRLKHRSHDIPNQAIRSRPWIDGDKVYYVSNRGELMCVDLNGFRDRENDGPHRKEKNSGPIDVDVLWALDMPRELGVFKRDAGDVSNPTSSPLVVGDLVYCVTGNGAYGYGRSGEPLVPKPDAPSFLAVNKFTGEVVWSSNLPGKNILYGQWSSPVHVEVAGHGQVVFPGGDGWLYAFEPLTGELVWKVDANDPHATQWSPPPHGNHNVRFFTVGTPIVYQGTVFASLSSDIEHGGPNVRSPVFAVDPRHRGDATDEAILWKFADKDFNHTVASVAIADDVLYTVSIGGVLFALDATSGNKLWQAQLAESPQEYNSPFVHAGKVYVGACDRLYVFAAGREKNCVGKYEFSGRVCYAPVTDGQRLYVGTRGHVWALRLPNK